MNTNAHRLARTPHLAWCVAPGCEWRYPKDSSTRKVRDVERSFYRHLFDLTPKEGDRVVVDDR